MVVLFFPRDLLFWWQFPSIAAAPVPAVRAERGLLLGSPRCSGGGTC